MSRTYAKVFVSIWGDDEFKQLSPIAQALYFRLLTDPRLSMCGVADWRPNRIAASADWESVDQVILAGKELSVARFVVIDEDTEEALIRTFVKHDGVLKSPNLCKAMVTDWTGIASSRLQSVVVREVALAAEEEPDMKGLPELPDRFTNGSETDPEPIWNPSESVPDQVTASSPILQPATTNPQPTEEPPRRVGTRLPEGWIPAEHVRAVIVAERPDLDIRIEHENFCDYWHSKTGKDATKLDWNLTWRKWMRNARGQNGRNSSAAKTTDWFAL